MVKIPRKVYTLEFKQEAVRLIESGQRVSEVARSLGKSHGVLCEGPEVKYAFIDRHRTVWPVCVQCRVLGVSATGYHQHRLRRALLAHIRAVHVETRGAYGWLRICRELRKRGLHAGRQRVQRLMQKHGIRARGRRRFRVATTDRRHEMPVAPNRLDRNFAPARPDTAWSGDISYIATDEGWLFLAVVIDLFSRRVVGWSLQPHMQRSLVIDALEMAWQQRRLPKGELLFGSLKVECCMACALPPSARQKTRCWNGCAGITATACTLRSIPSARPNTSNAGGSCHSRLQRENDGYRSRRPRDEVISSNQPAMGYAF
jgi:hypothetical protein